MPSIYGQQDMSRPSSPDPRQAEARQTCAACRNQKRKCDRGLPKCGLCTRTGRACDYSVVVRPAAGSLETLQQRLTKLEDHLSPRTRPDDAPSAASQSQSTGSMLDVAPSSSSPQAVGQVGAARVPLLLFLDVDRFRDSRLRLSPPMVRIPAVRTYMYLEHGFSPLRFAFETLTALQDVLAVLSFGNAVVDTAAVYFNTIHTWMPFISHKRMHLGIPLRNGGPDLAMLFLAMKLITSSPAGGTPPSYDPLYTMSKAFLAQFEANGEVSLHCLQAMVLIALYEYSHAVYPAAWTTVGACVRCADMLGITLGDERMGVLGQVASLWLITLGISAANFKGGGGGGEIDNLDRTGRAKTPLLGHLRARPGHRSWKSLPLFCWGTARFSGPSCR